MSTLIVPELSRKSKYWISKHRYYELKHFCLQYPEWKKEYLYLETKNFPDGLIAKTFEKNVNDRTAFSYLKSFMEIPCGKDLYYDRYHKFFYILAQSR